MTSQPFTSPAPAPAEGFPRAAVAAAYPLFSWSWFFTRSLLYTTLGAGISLMVGVSFGLATGQWAQSGLMVASYLMIGFGLALRSLLGERRQWILRQQRRDMDEARLARQRAELRLTVLQAQVEPHFLFNTLASVRSLVSQDPARAEATIDALVDYLRAAIPKLRGREGGGLSTLGEQFAMCESYLKVMKVRMGERLTYQVHVPEALAQVTFPALMLISLVENAIKHGLEPKPGPGRVDLVAERLGSGRVRVVVADNGLGLTEGLGTGVGLANIREQLITLYGDQAALELRGSSAGGVTATLTFPEGLLP
jgi:sensor histidine kinase YesM